MNREDLKKRTKDFAVRAIHLADALPRRASSDVLGRQLIRSATSVGANYRSACRGRSQNEFVAKLGVVIEEADEAAYWLELIVDTKLMKPGRVRSLQAEASELVAIFTAAVRTAKTRSQASKPSGSQIRNQES